MAKFVQSAKVELNLVLGVGEDEARALDALAGYGDDAFIKAFYEKLGSAYMEKHEKGLRSFLVSLRRDLPSILSSAGTARAAFHKSGGER